MTSPRVMIAIAVLASAAPAAADTVPLSVLGTRPPRADSEPITLPESFAIALEPLSVDSMVTTKAPFCLIGDWQHSTSDLDDDRRGLTMYLERGRPPLGIERLVVHGAKAELERTMIELSESGAATATAREHVALHVVGRLGDALIVYAYRAGDLVFVVAPTTGGGGARFDSRQPLSGRGVWRGQDCAYAITQLHVDAPSSQATQVLGAIGGRRYLIAASLSKTSRDPEPLLAVTARFADPR